MPNPEPTKACENCHGYGEIVIRSLGDYGPLEEQPLGIQKDPTCFQRYYNKDRKKPCPDCRPEKDRSEPDGFEGKNPFQYRLQQKMFDENWPMEYRFAVKEAFVSALRRQAAESEEVGRVKGLNEALCSCDDDGEGLVEKCERCKANNGK